MSSVSALFGKSLRSWLCEHEGVLSHGIAPRQFHSLLNGLATFLHLMEVVLAFGVPARPLLKDWLGFTLEDVMQLHGAIVAGDREFLQHARVNAMDHTLYPGELLHLKSELTGWCRDVSSMLAVAHQGHQEEAKRLLVFIASSLDAASDGTWEDDFCDAVRHQITDLPETIASLVHAALPVQWED